MKSAVLMFLLLNSACAIRKNLLTPYWASNQPVINDGGAGSAPDHGTKYCAPDANGDFTENPISPVTGMNNDGSAWASGGGCVLRPIREVWAAFNNMTVMKWNAVDSSTFVRTINPTPLFTHLYEITYSKATLIGEISWTMDWYHDPTQGTFLDPLEVTINYSRVSGTSNIPIWNGGVVLTKVNEGVTSFAVLNNFQARQDDSDNVSSAAETIGELINDARTGAPDWTSLNTGFTANPSQPDPPPPGTLH